MLKPLIISIILGLVVSFRVVSQNVSNQGGGGGDVKTKSEKTFKQPASQLALEETDKKIEENKKYQQKIAQKSSGYAGMARRYAELYEKKFWVRVGCGIIEAWNPNRDEFNWNNRFVPMLLGLEYKAGFFTVGAHLNMASMNSVSVKPEYASKFVSSKENYVAASFISKVYFRGAGYKFNPFVMAGLSYSFVNRTIERYNDNGLLIKDNESETPAGVIGKLGMDYMLLDYLGVNFNAGWGLTFFDLGLILKF